MKSYAVAVIACVVGLSAALPSARAETATHTASKPSHAQAGIRQAEGKEVTLRGMVHVTKDAKGEVTAVAIMPSSGGANVKVALDEEGKKLAGEANKTVTAAGTEHAGVLTVKSYKEATAKAM
ncbi:MAG: hypothetical protein K8T26_20090 [Lentisphaerae bacterium]|nr:hypothetical protein [Lentisphaerota bacterium]